MDQVGEFGMHFAEFDNNEDVPMIAGLRDLEGTISPHRDPNRIIIVSRDGSRLEIPDALALARMAPAISGLIGEKEITLLQEFPGEAIAKAVDYCKLHDYSKVTNNIQFPLASSKLEDSMA